VVELSVIIPTYNRTDRLLACLEALSHQTQSASDFEVIVVVDGSTDGTREMLANLVVPYILRVIWQQNSGQCAALNHGVEAASGECCLFLDDDIIADPGLVAEHLRVQRECEGVVSIGQITLTLPPNADWFARCFAQGWSDHYTRLNQRMRAFSWMDCYGGNMAVPRTAFLEVGGFTLNLARAYDVELGYRLEQRGFSFVYIPEAIGNQDERKSFVQLTADVEKSGYACVELFRRYPSTFQKLLGSFCEAKLCEILLRRLLLMLGISPRLLSPIGVLLRKQSWRYSWYRFLHEYCYWLGVRRSITDRYTWKRIIGAH
jgi:glycosyltransferase involved in cell wall biosynthesis